jgi:predicted amidophosphoribosyltransferase
MKKQKKARLLNVETIKSIKLCWKAGRQLQQELLQDKLLKCFLDPSEERPCIARYPEAMHPMIEDFVRKAEKQMRLSGT